MAIQAVCAIAANREDMSALLDKMPAAGFKLGDDAVPDILDKAKTGDEKPVLFSVSEALTHRFLFEVVRRGDTYVMLFRVSQSSQALHSLLQEIASLMPPGGYGIAYSFAWDFEPDMVALNTDDAPYPGGGADYPWHLEDLDYEYESYKEWRKWLNRKAQKIEALEQDDDVQHIAEAEALRWWKA